ncbi:MAG: ferrous iron transport protein A [Acidimicrobiia bacterium]|nr:ferrous iron transport protein A [Acidimicrobiia bacterium]
MTGSNTAGLMPLSAAPHREPVTVRRLTASEPATVRRIAELGLTPGAKIQILQESSSALIISARSCRVAVGRSLAHSVLVDTKKAPA